MNLVELQKWCDVKNIVPSKDNIHNLIYDYDREMMHKQSEIVLNPEYLDTIRRLHGYFDGRLIFCGSMSLYLAGLIDRHPNDIDVISLDNHVRDDFIGYEEMDRNGGSGIFYIDDKKVECYAAIDLSTKIEINVFYIDSTVTRSIDIVICDGLTIKVEVPSDTIKAKKTYMRNMSCTTKHDEDLRHMSMMFQHAKKIDIDDLPFNKKTK